MASYFVSRHLVGLFLNDMHAVWNRIMESGKFFLVETGISEIFLVESGILGFGIWNTTQGILIPLRIESSTSKNPESSTRNQESRIHAVEFRIQDHLGFPYMGTKMKQILMHTVGTHR